MTPAIRSGASARLVQSFSATSPKTIQALGARTLSISGHRDANPIMSSFESTMANIPKRSDIPATGTQYNTSRTAKSVNDNSTVDFAYIPAISFTHATSNTAPEPHVTRAEISTASLSDAVTTVSEAEVSKAADGMGLKEVAEKKDNVVKRVWNDFVDDILSVGSGSKGTAHA